MAITRTAKGTDAQSSSGTTCTVSSVTIAAGATVVVCVQNESIGLSGVTWNGYSLTQRVIVNNGADSRAYIYSYYSAAGGTGDVVATWSSAETDRAIQVIELTNVDSSDPVPSGYTGTGTANSANMSATTSGSTSGSVMVIASYSAPDGGSGISNFGANAPNGGQTVTTTNFAMAEAYGASSASGNKSATADSGARCKYSEAIACFVESTLKIVDVSDTVEATDSVSREPSQWTRGSTDTATEADAVSTEMVFERGLSALQKLDPTITVDGSDYTPSGLWFGGRATTSVLPASGYGSDLAIAGSGSDVLTGKAIPALRSGDQAFEGAGGKYFNHATQCNVTTEDFIIEIFHRTPDGSFTTDYMFGKGSGASTATPGYGLYASVNGGRLVLQVTDATSRTWYDCGETLAHGECVYEMWAFKAGSGWVHAVRADLANGVRVIHNQVAAVKGSLTNSSAFSIGGDTGYQGPLNGQRFAYGAIWIASSMLNTSAEITALATARFAQLEAELRTISDDVTVDKITEISRTVSDTPAETDNVDVEWQFHRKPSEALTETDAVAREAQFERAATEALTEADTVGREAQFERSVTEALTEADAVALEVQFERSVSDSPAEADSVTRQATFERTISDTADATDSAGAGMQLEAELSDSLTETDSVSTEVEFERSVSDAPAETDAVLREATFERALSDALTEADTVDREVIASGSTIERDAADGITETDNVDIEWQFHRKPSESLAESDNVDLELQYAKTLSDTVDAGDAVATEMQFERTASESLSESDSVSLAQEHERSVSDALTEQDNLKTEWQFHRIVSDTPAETDAASRELTGSDTINRSVSDTIGETDNVERWAWYAKTLTEAESIADAIAAELQAERETSDSATASDAVAVAMEYGRSAGDTATASDGISRWADYYRLLSSTAVAADYVSASLESDVILRSVSDTAAASDDVRLLLEPVSTYLSFTSTIAKNIPLRSVVTKTATLVSTVAKSITSRSKIG